VTRSANLPHLSATPLAAWERDGVVAVLKKAGLPADDVDSPGALFWRFETADVGPTEFGSLELSINPRRPREADVVPVGFGGLELYGTDALLRSIVTLPPVRHQGIGAAIVAILEVEARGLGGRTLWLLTPSAAQFFAGLGYAKCERAEAPEPIRRSRQFSALCRDATVMTKQIE
jgi:amino-acid N-acetyltransferase